MLLAKVRLKTVAKSGFVDRKFKVSELEHIYDKHRDKANIKVHLNLVAYTNTEDTKQVCEARLLDFGAILLPQVP